MTSETTKIICTICRGSLGEKGPPLRSFSFGKLFARGPKTAEDRQLLKREFPGSLTERGTRRRFDTSKTLVTPCGHVFHSGCLREWLFVQRDDPEGTKCPLCLQPVTIRQCAIVFPSTYEERKDTGSVDKSTGTEKVVAPMQTHLRIYWSTIAIICTLSILYRIFRAPNTEQLDGKEKDSEQRGIVFAIRVTLGKTVALMFVSAWVTGILAVSSIIRRSMSRNTVPEGRSILDFRKTLSFCLFVVSFYANFWDKLHLISGFGSEDFEDEEDEDYVLKDKTFVLGVYWAMCVGISCTIAIIFDCYKP